MDRYLTLGQLAWTAFVRAAIAVAIPAFGAVAAQAGTNTQLLTDWTWWKAALASVISGAVAAGLRALAPERSDAAGVGLRPSASGRLGLAGPRVSGPRP